jgi:hypothetical protein
MDANRKVDKRKLGFVLTASGFGALALATSLILFFTLRKRKGPFPSDSTVYILAQGGDSDDVYLSHNDQGDLFLQPDATDKKTKWRLIRAIRKYPGEDDEEGVYQVANVETGRVITFDGNATSASEPNTEAEENQLFRVSKKAFPPIYEATEGVFVFSPLSNAFSALTWLGNMFDNDRAVFTNVYPKDFTNKAQQWAVKYV